MKRCLVFTMFLLCSLMLVAQPLADVRIAQNIRFTGFALRSSGGENWVLWEEEQGSGYQLWGTKYNGYGQAMFADPLHIPLAEGNIKLLQTEAASDNGIIILFMLQTNEGGAELRLQKINFAGMPQWTEGGIILANVLDIKDPDAVICANNLGGAFVVYLAESGYPESIYAGLNLDGAGNNVWTAPENITIPQVYRLSQLLLTDTHELLLNFQGHNYSSYMMKVDNSGAVIGNNPFFSEGVELPTFPMLVKSTNDSYLIHSQNSYGMSDFYFQKMDADGNLLWDEMAVIPALGTYWGDLKIKALDDGGYIMSYKSNNYSGPQNNELYTLRLDANMQPLWGSEQVALFSTEDYILDSDVVVDESGNFWYSFVVMDGYYDNATVRISKLDMSGNIILNAIPISSDTQIKNSPRLLTLTNQMMLAWGENYADKVAVKRQILSPLGQAQLPQNGVDLSSRISGTTWLHEVYNLGERSISLWDDDRFVGNELYYQILDTQLSPLLPAHGLAISGDARGPQIFLRAAVSEDNTLWVCYKVYNGDNTFTMHLQEIDANGLRTYPGHGLMLFQSNNSTDQAALAFHDGATYIYWTEFSPTGNFNTIIKGQKIVGGTPLWQEGGIIIYDQPNTYCSQLFASGPYLVYAGDNNSAGTAHAKALRLEADGSVADDWDASGVTLWDTEGWNSLMLVHGVGMIDDDLYAALLVIDGESVKLVMQRVLSSGDLPWGIAGTTVTADTWNFIDVSPVIFSHNISIAYHIPQVGSFFQRINSDGDLVWGPWGINLGANVTNGDMSGLIEYESGSHSFFWVEYGEHYSMPMAMKHVYVYPDGSLHDPQVIHSGNISRIRCVNNGDSAHIYSSEISSDVFGWESKTLFSIYASSFPGPTSIDDPLQEQIVPVLLEQNYPNPFRESTSITVKLQEARDADIMIFNIKGQLVTKLDLPAKSAGEYVIDWDGRDSSGARCAAGVYLYKVKSGRYSAGKKMILLR